MPKRFVRQPNGLMAEFSTIVDHFTACDMEEDEAIRHAGYGLAGLGRRDSIAKVQRGVDDDMTGIGPRSGKGDGLDRFRDAIETVRIVHGDEEAERMARILSASPDDPGRKTF